MGIVISILTFVLILISLFLSLVVLAQKSKDGGVGAAMGGGAAEAAFGAETNNVLSKATINAAIAFFVLCFALYLGHIYQRKHAAATGSALPTIAVPAAPTATPAADAAAPAAAPAGEPSGAPKAEQPKSNP
ncbi:MAG: preprotein translocase subunit SecG [Opitutaceae bacterium]|nr:preprotein translocase subunit SecG [Opitutaceae bacterium]